MIIFGVEIPLWVIIAAFTILIILVILVAYGILTYKRYPKQTEFKKYAFFIPARNEENVIGNLIKSIREMDYPQDKITIFVLANNCSKTDRTAEIAKELGAEVFEIKDENVTNVGMVLEKFFDYIKEYYENYQAFDGYIRLDADNILDKNYLSKLNDAFLANPTVIASYRANQNFNDGLRASLSCMLVTQAMMAFRMFSGWGVNPIITGPGLLIGADVLEKMGGWHLTTLSEDMELSALLAKMKIRVYFCYDAIFYDEQVSTLKLALRQRLRWTTGTNQVFFKYWFTMIKRVFSKIGKSAFFLVIGLVPMGLISVLFTLLFLVIAIIGSITKATFDPIYTFLIITVAMNTIPGWITAILTVIVEGRRIKAPWYKKLIYIFIFPLSYMLQTIADFIRIFIKVKWKPIPHGQTKLK